MPTCKQSVEIFLLTEDFNKAPLWDAENQKRITVKSEGDFDIELREKEARFCFGFINVQVPKDAFLIEVGRALMDECCGGDFAKWYTKQKQNQ